MTSIQIGYKDALKKKLIQEGTHVISYPNRKGQAHKGEILAIIEGSNGINEIVIEYTHLEDQELINPKRFVVSEHNGRSLFDDLETNLDVMLICKNS